MTTFRIHYLRAIFGLVALASLVTLTLVPSISAKSKRRGAIPGTSVAHDAHGLEKQYEPLLKAYSKGNQEDIDKEFSVFVLPELDKWFAEYFAATDVEKLRHDYETKASDHKKFFIAITTKALHTSERFYAHCSPPDPDYHPKFQPLADAPKPTHEVPIEKFRIEYTSDDGKKFSEFVNFVYVDGAFRYLGNGFYPFWEMPDLRKKSAPKAEN
jgi:hypothetical protein